MESELSSIISGSETLSVKELYKMRTDILETINAEIKKKKEVDRVKRNKNKKIVRPRMYISDSSDDEFQDKEKNPKKENQEISPTELEDEINEDESSLNVNKIKNRRNNPKKEYFNFFRKYKIQDVIRPRQVILVQINR